ncbi:MAG: PilN domain-containing protein, partial [Neomegalonema sp.]|nr:PilN domain-containing protein [Neomegalonema sp.]
ETARDKAEQEMEVVNRIKRSTLGFVDRALAPLKRRRAERPALEWLDAIAEALPPGSVAERIVMSGGVVRVEGVTDKPDGVLSALEAAPAFTGVRYAEPLRALEGDDQRQRFTIEAKLAPPKPDA